MAPNEFLNVLSAASVSYPTESAPEGSADRLPVTFRPIEESLHTGKFREYFPAYNEGLVESSPGGYITTPMLAARAQEVYNLKPRPDDVYV